MPSRLPLVCDVEISVRPIPPLAALRSPVASQTQSRKRQLTEGITMQTLKAILHATDFSTLSTGAFHAAFGLARAHGARLILLYVRQPQETIQREFGLMPPEPEASDADILIRLGELVPEGSPIQVERIVVCGKAAETIVEVAREKHCDLIVIGTHGRKGLARFFYGNVADTVARTAPCPVLALRSSKTEKEPSEEPSEDPRDLVRLAAAANSAQAHIWKQGLEQEGIRCQVLGDDLEAGFGDLQGFSAEIWVEAADVARAEEILRQHHDDLEVATQADENT
jgi:nucleotide-binding universal stress UspA family protein